MVAAAGISSVHVAGLIRLDVKHAFWRFLRRTCEIRKRRVSFLRTHVCGNQLARILMKCLASSCKPRGLAWRAILFYNSTNIALMDNGIVINVRVRLIAGICVCPRIKIRSFFWNTEVPCPWRGNPSPWTYGSCPGRGNWRPRSLLHEDMPVSNNSGGLLTSVRQLEMNMQSNIKVCALAHANLTFLFREEIYRLLNVR